MRRYRKMRGGNFLKWAAKVGKFIQKNKLVSKGARALGSIGVPYAARVGKVAGQIGLGFRLPGGRATRGVRRPLRSRYR